MKVVAIRAFRGLEGYVPRGTEIEVSELRAADLRRVGLVAEAAEKVAQAPANKKAPATQNKAK